MAATTRPPRVALDRYLQRLAYAGSLQPSQATLEALHLAHATRIPFENLDVLLGRPIDLSIDALERKLVDARRGGYCFEQNLLFGAVLEDLGFAVTPLAARVRHDPAVVLPRTHMLLLVETERGRWIADVGFGGEGLLQPVPFDPPAESPQFLWTYRVVEEGRHFVLQSRRGDEWRDLYVFSLEPQERVDYEVANYWISTHPASRFVQTLTVQMPTPEARWIIRNRELTIDRGGESTAREIRDHGELLDLLASRFGLHFPPETTFPKIFG
ncbi:MAG TPA: arylamine N-acetyltransferase [Vicinamibacterales bacterium]|nr:arylamine N-acetyltransferase [Vicinamibacterales bacterium]